jgi:very-short-patch-repair endonuclease
MIENGRRLAALAASQEYLVTVEQFRALGMSNGAIRHRLRTGSLQLHLPRVYRFSHARQTIRQQMIGAILYAGHGAVASHRWAAALWGMLPHEPGRPVDVTVASGQPRSRPEVRVHRSRTLTAADIRVRDGIRVASPSRALLDVAASASLDQVEDALTEAIVLGLTSAAEIRRQVRRAPTAKGSRRLLLLLAVEEEHGYSRAKSERLLRALLKPTGLPMPVFNAIVCGHRVDCSWAKQRLIVEVDGYRFHGDRATFESDRRRDQDLVAAGWRVIRVTWRQLTKEPTIVLVKIAQALAVG